MPGKPTPSTPQEKGSSSTVSKSYRVWSKNPLGLYIALGIITVVLFFYYRPWQIYYGEIYQGQIRGQVSDQSQTPYPEEIKELKNLVVALNNRINQMESREKAAPSFPGLEQIMAFESRVSALQQQVETLQNQPKTDGASVLEKSQTFEKEIVYLAEAQKLIKAMLLFQRLKNKVLSDAPYALELDAYKAVSKPDDSLSLLEKYADHGLQLLKETSEEHPSGPSLKNETVSWRDRLKAAIGSLIKIEKIEASPRPSFNQDRQAIENLLGRIDQALAQQLEAPLPGDILK